MLDSQLFQGRLFIAWSRCSKDYHGIQHHLLLVLQLVETPLMQGRVHCVASIVLLVFNHGVVCQRLH
jgi:hypothetical protein